MLEIQFSIPGNPTAWGRTHNRIITSAKTGKQFVSNYTPAKTRSEEGVVRHLAALEMGMSPPFDGPVQIALAFMMPIPASFSKAARDDALNDRRFPTTKPDFDNLTKLVTDAMNGIVYHDDRQIVTAYITKRFSAQPTVRVWVKAVPVRRPGAKG